jgi:amylovoran biosynthesis protein AmsF
MANNMISVGSIEELKFLEPSSTNDFVYVRSFYEGKNVGGGNFYYDSVDKRTATDNVTIFVTPKGARWKKVIEDANLLDVTNFGAIPDGVTDCSNACLAMHKWSQKNSPRLGIQFPAGTFKLNGIDLSSSSMPFFRMVGAPVAFGYFPTTTLVSDQDSGMMIKVKARWSEFGNFLINGENNLKEFNYKLNTKGFFQNIEIEGQYIRGTNLRFANMGGICISLVDTLDTKIDQFYASKCVGGVIKAEWSDSSYHSWDHSTAIELTNFNMQDCTGDAQVFDLQRCTQSIIRNGWLERCTNPGDLSNGQWVIEALSMEGCVNPLNLTYCRYIMSQKNLQGTSAITISDSSKSSWLSIWEDGNVNIENYGIKTNGSMNYGHLTSQYRLSNNSQTSNWFKVGDVFVPGDGDTVNIRLVGSLGFSSSTNTHEVANGRHGNGEALIRLQKKSGGIGMTWEGFGSCPVLDVMYIAESNKTNCAIYVKLGPYVMNTAVILESSAKDRFYAGVCFRWTFDGSKTTEDEIKALSGVQALGQASWNAGNNGIVLSADGYIGLKTLPIENNQLPLYINGVLYKIALTK